jgi:hypothetical protein
MSKAQVRELTGHALLVEIRRLDLGQELLQDELEPTKRAGDRKE